MNIPKDDKNKPVYMISVAAGLTGMHPQTLRIYERKKLVEPGRTAKSTRLYSRSDIERLQHIQQLTQAEGVNLAGVKIIMELQNRLEEIKKTVAQMEEELASAESRMREEIREATKKYRYELVPVPRERRLVTIIEQVGGKK